jgi:hypothetical protein
MNANLTALAVQVVKGTITLAAALAQVPDAPSKAILTAMVAKAKA